MVPTEAQTALYLEFRRLLDRSVRWFLQTRPARLDIGAEIERFRAVVAELGRRLPEPARRATSTRRLQEDARAAGPPGRARRSWRSRGAGLLIAFRCWTSSRSRTSTGAAPQEVARVYFTLSERYGVDAC